MNLQNELRKIRTHQHTELMPELVAYNNEVRNSWIHIWARNAGENYARIKELFQERDCNVGNLPQAPGMPVLILGSGPSLDDWSPYIKQWKGAIFCSTSQLAWCEYHGVTPTYVSLIDADPSMVYLMQQSPFRKTVPLITHPQVPKGVFDTWEAPIWLYRMYDPGCEFSSKFLPMMYGWLNEKTNWRLAHFVLNAGNIMNNMVSLSAALLYAPVILAGYDLGYPEKQWRFTNYKKSEAGEWEQIPDPGIPEGREVYPAGNGVLIDRLVTYYKYSFVIMWGIAAPIIASSSRGSIGELPYVTPEEVVACDGHLSRDKLYTAWEAYNISQTYLRPRGILIFKGHTRKRGTGMGIVNMQDLKGVKRIFYLIWWHLKRGDTYRWPDDSFRDKRPYHWMDTWRAVENIFRTVGKTYDRYLDRLYGAS